MLTLGIINDIFSGKVDIDNLKLTAEDWEELFLVEKASTIDSNNALQFDEYMKEQQSFSERRLEKDKQNPTLSEWDRHVLEELHSLNNSPEAKKEEAIKTQVSKLFYSFFSNNGNFILNNFASSGGWHDIYRVSHDMDSYTETAENDAIPIIEILEILNQSSDIEIKSYSTVNKTIKLTNRTQSLLAEIITEYFKDKVRVSFDWRQDLEQMKGQLRQWNTEKIKAGNRKHIIGYLYEKWNNIISWEASQNKTDRYVFLYELGTAFDLYQNDKTLNRKEKYDLVKNKISSYRNWVKK